MREGLLVYRGHEPLISWGRSGMEPTMSRKLQTRLSHMRGTTLSVGGSDFTVSHDLCVEGLSDEQAERLLAGKNWSETLGSTPSRAPRRLGLVGTVPQALTQDAEPAAAAAKAEAPPTDASSPGPAPEPPPEGAESEAVDPDGNPVEEWPWPASEHSGAYLRKMADAYGVEYKSNTAKAKLVETITEAMSE